MDSSMLYHTEEKQALMLTMGDEFNYKVQYDFTKIVFLGLQIQKELCLSDVLKYAASLQGYLMHRTVSYRERFSHLFARYNTKSETISDRDIFTDDNVMQRERICHIYIRYSTTSEAYAARDTFREQEGFHAEVVVDILRCLYGYEVNSKRPPCPTIGFLDTVGEVTFSDPLSEVNARNLLVKFGYPLIHGIQDGLVKVSFYTMAEGLGACIAYGQWFYKFTPQDTRFYYRVQLDTSEHLSELVNSCNRTLCDSEAFNLEYFSPKSDGTDSQNVSYESTSHTKNYFSTGVTRYVRQFSRGRGGHKLKVAKHYKPRSFYGTQGKFVNSVS